LGVRLSERPVLLLQPSVKSRTFSMAMNGLVGRRSSPADLLVGEGTDLSAAK